jgi:hypothetical protein
MLDVRKTLLLAFMCLAVHRTAMAQIDPFERELVELGYNQAIHGAEPIAAYGYFYDNQPHYPWTNTTLRLVYAGVYFDGELGFNHLLGPNTDFAIGLAGGAFADSDFEYAQGKFLKGSSFFGHAAEVSASVYHLFNPGQRIPLSGVFRIRERYSFFQRDSGETSPTFILPPSHSMMAVRTGLRWGGRDPVLRPELAMELSAWAEAQYRTDSKSYGYNGDRVLEPHSELVWARGLLIYTLPDSKQSFSATVNGGAVINPDRSSAYRLGADMPLAAEFPLSIPGYFFNELSARDFVDLSLEYVLPLDPDKNWRLHAIGAVANVDYLGGLAQPGHFNSGVGGGVEYHSPGHMWMLALDYGYGFEAIRDHGRGGQDISLHCQIDLEAPDRHGRINGFQRLLQHIFWKGQKPADG